METSKKKNTNYEKAICTGGTLIVDLMCQLINLIVELNKETKKLNIKKNEIMEGNIDRKESGSPITVRAYKTSIAMLMFDSLESICNFLSKLILLMNEGLEGSPQVEYHLNQVEIDLLKEQKTYMDCRTGKIKVNDSNFIPTMDKLTIVPFLLGKIYDIEFKIDKGGKGWQGLLELKQLRDELTHPKFNLDIDELNDSMLLDTNNIKPSVVISNMKLFEGTESIRWYWGNIRKLFEVSGLITPKSVINNIFSVDFLLWLIMLNLNEGCNIKEFDKKYPSPIKMSEQGIH